MFEAGGRFRTPIESHRGSRGEVRWRCPLARSVNVQREGIEVRECPVRGHRFR